MVKFYFFAVLLCGLTFSLESQATEFSGGTGTANEPYLIKTADDLGSMADAITSGNQFADTYFQLANDIDLKDDVFFSIGTKDKPFKGIFDGNSKTINKMVIFPSGQNGAGLFGAIDQEAIIKDLSITSSSITTIGSEETYHIGAICGYNKGKISNCTVKNTILQGSKGIGGIVGTNMPSGIVENCSFSGKVSGTWWIGGIVGTIDKNAGTTLASGYITNCQNYGEIFGIKHVGGIVGMINPAMKVSLCYNSGSTAISGGSGLPDKYETDAGVGGIAGYITAGTIEKCTNSGKVESIQSAVYSYAGGIAGRCYSGIIINCCNTASCTGNNYAYAGGLVGKYDGSSKLESSYTTTGGSSDYQAGMITPDPSSSSISATIKSCFYDLQPQRSIGGPGIGKLTKEMTGESLKELFGTDDWIYENGMYPRLKGMETLPNIILATSPILCYSNEDGKTYDRWDFITHSITIPTGNSITWKVDNNEYWKIENSQLTLLKRPTDEIIPCILTATLGELSRTYPVNIVADLGGDGSESSPYQLTSIKQFNYFATTVANGETYEGKFIKLINDLDMQGNETNLSMPVGSKNINFEGTFDGNQKNISNFYYKSSNSPVGLFMNLGKKGIIKNFTLASGYIEGVGIGTVGGIVGKTGGIITNCANYATVKGLMGVGGIAGSYLSGATEGQVYNCYNAGTIIATRSNAGGIMGENSAFNIENCYNFGTVTIDGTGGGNALQPGGIVGFTTKSVINCINYGTITHLTNGVKSMAGGIAGRTGGSASAPAKITGCINVAPVMVTVGGTAGAIVSTKATYDIIENCFYDSQMSINSTSYPATSISTLELTNGELPQNLDANIWQPANKMYPMLKNMADTDAAILASTPIFLETGNTALEVNKNFKVGGNDETVWATENSAIIAINGKNITLTLPTETTKCNLTATYKGNSKTTHFIVLDKTTGIEKVEQQSKYNVYTDNKAVIIENAINANIQLYDATGKLYIDKKAASDKEIMSISSSGLYIVKIVIDATSYTTKIVIK